jgi:hypothetical protein
MTPTAKAVGVLNISGPEGKGPQCMTLCNRRSVAYRCAFGEGALMRVDTFLFNGGWLFFAAWIAVVGVTAAAFGRDLLERRRHPHPKAL